MSSAPVIDESETEARAAVGGPPVSGFKPFRVTVDRFNRMIAAGVLGEGEPVILWKGRLVETMTKGSRHCVAVTLLAKLLSRMEPPGYHVRQEQPMRVADDGLPEPDLTFVRGEIRDYSARLPTTADVAIVIEVADSSLALDSGEVLEAYASQSISVYWIVNLPKRRVEVYREPSGPIEAPGFRIGQHYRTGETVPVVLDGVEVGRVAVDDILP